jgi:hypothetical protein
MKTSTIFLVLQGAFVGYLVNLVLPVSEGVLAFLFCCMINSVLVVAYGASKSTND